MIQPMTSMEAYAGTQRLGKWFQVDGYNVSRRPRLAALETWIHDLGHLVCIGFEAIPDPWYLPMPSASTSYLSMRISCALARYVEVRKDPRGALDWQEILTVGTELALLRHLGVCEPENEFEFRVVRDASQKLATIGPAVGAELMFRSARSDASAARAEKVRQILSQP